MDKDLAFELSKQLKINVNQVVREYWEMIILRDLMESKIGDCLVFIGGTALRLAYNSPRFSDDLDFYLRKKLTKNVFEKEIKEIADKNDLVISDLKEKKAIFLAEFKIKEEYLPLSFRIKIEIRKKIIKKDYELRLLVSPAVNFDVLCFVLDLLKMQEFKMMALKKRKEPRDLFDLWFIAQKMKVPFKKPNVKMDKKITKQVLYKYLPSSFYSVVDELLK